MKKYEKYKESGIEWIDEVPEGWSILDLKRTAQTTTGLTFTKADLVEEGLPVISYGQIHAKSNTGTSVSSDLIRYIPDSLTEGKESALVSKGDFIFADTSEDLDGCGNCVYIDGNTSLFAGYHTTVLRLNDKGNGKYLSYLFKTDEWRSQLRSRVNGVKLYSITQGILKSTSIILPPIREQQAITGYLDSQCSRIDEMISAKTKQMDALKEYRTSLISEVVTKGLNTEAEMVNSGIESIDNFPKEWKIVRLKYLLDSPLQYGASETGEEDRPEYPRYIRITDITEENSLRVNGVKYLAPQLAAPYMLKKGDVLFARSGATVGKTFLFDSDAPSCFAGYLIKASCGEKLLPKYLFFYTRSKFYENWKNAIFTQATIQNIGADKYNELPMLLPPITIQHEIVKFLDEKCSKIADILASLEAEILELKRYKTSVISEVVTGKVKVF